MIEPHPLPESSVPPARILLVDDQELVRIGLRLVLGAEPDMRVVGEAESGQQAVQIARELAPDVVLMDVRMPGQDGAGATHQIVRDCPGSAVIALTSFDVDEHALAMLHAGARGFLLKDAGPVALCGAVRAVRAGGAVISPAVTRRMLDRYSARLPAPAPGGIAFERLTPRESEILGAIGEGLNNAELADRFTLAESTVKTHVGRILKKLHLRDRVHAALYAYRTAVSGRGSMRA